VKFVSIRLKNWRSFHGENQLDFSVDPERPVTLILGSNGAGKTALLNAFTWVIFGEFTEGFDRHDDLINHDALEEYPGDDAEVELILEDNGKTYKVRRTVNSAQQAGNLNEISVIVDGATDVEEAVHKLIPKALKELFFFPAESFSTAKVLRAPGRAAHSSTLRIDTAIRTLLAGDVYDNAAADLRAAVKSPALKTPKGLSNAAMAAAGSAYDQAQADLVDAQEQISSIPDEIAEAEAEAAKAEKVASQYDPESIQKFNEELDQKKKDVTDAQKNVDKANKLYIQLARNSHSHFTGKAIRAAVQRLDVAEECGMIPPRIDRKVIEHTIDNDVCALCGEQLTTAGMQKVLQLKEKVADSTTAVRGMEARTQLKQYLKVSESDLIQLRKDVTVLTEGFSDIPPPADGADPPHLCATIRACIKLAHRMNERTEVSLKAFWSEAPSQPTENVVKLALAKKQFLDALESRLEGLKAGLGQLKAARDTAFTTLEAKSKDSKESVDRVNAIRLIEEAREFFEEASNGLTDCGREDFERAINETYRQLVKKPYQIRVDSAFKLQLVAEGTDRVIAASQAENVLLLIAFLGAIARLAPIYQKIREEKAQFKKVGTVMTSGSDGFPVVIDAPTSALDEEYELEVIKALPDLLPQIIIPVSAKSVEKWEANHERIGRVFVMELTSKGQTDRHTRWGGKDHVYSLSHDTIVTRTRIVPIA
jgi:energy-coupling factor transporter ATP-binding protein EcfA2